MTKDLSQSPSARGVSAVWAAGHPPLVPNSTRDSTRSRKRCTKRAFTTSRKMRLSFLLKSQITRNCPKCQSAWWTFRRTRKSEPGKCQPRFHLPLTPGSSQPLRCTTDRWTRSSSMMTSRFHYIWRTISNLKVTNSTTSGILSLRLEIQTSTSLTCQLRTSSRAPSCTMTSTRAYNTRSTRDTYSHSHNQ